jgi:hypothetical protein
MKTQVIIRSSCFFWASVMLSTAAAGLAADSTQRASAIPPSDMLLWYRQPRQHRGGLGSDRT